MALRKKIDLDPEIAQDARKLICQQGHTQEPGSINADACWECYKIEYLKMAERHAQEAERLQKQEELSRAESPEALLKKCVELLRSIEFHVKMLAMDPKVPKGEHKNARRPL